jgi:hypothetical protein
MTLLRCAAALVLIVGTVGCDTGRPERASDIQNLNAINDDIAAVTMTQSPTSRAHDPNLQGPIPRTYQTHYTR